MRRPHIPDHGVSAVSDLTSVLHNRTVTPTDGPGRIAKAEALIEDLYYQTVKATTLRTQLLCARHGYLDIDWRSALIEITAEPVEGIAEKHQLIRERAARDVANLSDADWEPDMKVGWRASLEAWFAATKECLDDIEELQKRTRAEAGLSVDGIAERHAMDLDVETASYRAGLTAAGLVSDWYGWLLERVRKWPDAGRRDVQLAAMKDPEYRAGVQQLPAYWA
jgi:hypothetical protein